MQKNFLPEKKNSKKTVKRQQNDSKKPRPAGRGLYAGEGGREKGLPHFQAANSASVHLT